MIHIDVNVHIHPHDESDSESLKLISAHDMITGIKRALNVLDTRGKH